MPENDKLTNIVAIVKLAETLTPLAVSLIRQLADKMVGKSDDEILDEADATFAQIQQAARDAQQ